MTVQARPFSAAAERNLPPILEALRPHLQDTGLALEVASGTGQHAAGFARALPQWTWQPTDTHNDALEAIRAWTHDVPNVRPPTLLDVCNGPWPEATSGAVDLVFCANMLHISPWATCAALMQGASQQLKPGGLLAVYGPFLEADVPTAPSNLAFDADLRQRNPAWGIRTLEAVHQAAAAAGLTGPTRIVMPSNNLLLLWRKPGVAA
jgi:SAM-dependent methyltransferase